MKATTAGRTQRVLGALVAGSVVVGLLGAAVVHDLGVLRWAELGLTGSGALVMLARRPLRDPLLAVWFGLLVGGVAVPDLGTRATGYTHLHYMLNSRYFAELGYTDLYDQLLAAHQERDTPAFEVHEVRNLVTYAREPVGVRERSVVWTDARWASFRQDLEWYFGLGLPWDDLLVDRGYNATPTGNALYRTLARTPTSQRGADWVALVDVVGIVGSLLWVARVFGLRTGALVASCLLVFFGHQDGVFGMPMQFDYLCALLCMACAMKRRQWGLAGGLLGFAAMVRVFPGLLFAGPALWACGRVLSGQALPRGFWRFGAGFGIALALGFALGCTSARGPGAWVEWRDNIATHTRVHRTGAGRIGAGHIATFEPSAVAEAGRWPTIEMRDSALQHQAPLWWGAAATGSLLLAVAIFRLGARDDDPLDSTALALGFVFWWLVLSRYYWCVLLLLLLHESRGRRRAAGLLACMAVWLAASLWIDKRYGWFWLFNVAFMVWWLETTWRMLADGGARATEAPST